MGDKKHAVEFRATEEKNRYKIKTHACDKKCYAAYKKGLAFLILLMSLKILDWLLIKSYYTTDFRQFKQFVDVIILICQKKVPENPDYVLHKMPNDMNGYGDIWFFDLKNCDVDIHFTDLFFNFFREILVIIG